MTVDAAPIAFPAMTAADQVGAIATLEAALADVGRPELTVRLAHRLGKGDSGFVLAIDRLRHRKHYRETDEVGRFAIDSMRSAVEASRAEQDDLRWLETDRTWEPIASAVVLVISPEGPDAEIERRRGIVETRRATDEAALKETIRRQKLRDNTMAESSARNGDRACRFYGLSRETQITYVAAAAGLASDDPLQRTWGYALRFLGDVRASMEREKVLSLPSEKVFRHTAFEVAAFRRWQQSHPDIPSAPIEDEDEGSLRPGQPTSPVDAPGSVTGAGG